MYASFSFRLPCNIALMARILGLEKQRKKSQRKEKKLFFLQDDFKAHCILFQWHIIIRVAVLLGFYSRHIDWIESGFRRIQCDILDSSSHTILRRSFGFCSCFHDFNDSTLLARYSFFFSSIATFHFKVLVRSPGITISFFFSRVCFQLETVGE